VRGFVWTLGSWVVWCALETARGPQRRQIKRGVLSGDLCWQELPFRMHNERLDGWLLDEELRIADALGQCFAPMTCAAEMTDVPRHTSAIVPALADPGVSLLHIGPNPASQVPADPAASRWCTGHFEVNGAPPSKSGAQATYCRV